MHAEQAPYSPHPATPSAQSSAPSTQHSALTPREQQPRRVLVMMAHPDDPEFVAGGTIAGWCSEGAWVGYLICTGGDKGSEDASIPAEELIGMRHAEQRRAAARLGVQAVDFLDFRDGELEHTLALRGQLVAAIRRHKPDTVVCFDPSSRFAGDWYIQHPDHYTSGEAVLAAIYPAARNRRTFPELLAQGLEPHTVEQVYLAATNEPNRWVDIEATLDKKIAAMLEHTSQVSDPEGLSQFLRKLAADAGRGQGLAAAEAFRFIDASGG
ncbi:MAG: PIG-L deacetylase family protein [Dehalococcoidia bacterium]